MVENTVGKRNSIKVGKRNSITVEKRNSIIGMSFFGPALVLMAIFLFIPMILTFVFSFTDYFALNPSLTNFVGLENYISLFKDKLFAQAFKNTVLFVIIIVPLQTGLAFGLALFIDRISYCKSYFKLAFFIPVVMSLAVVSTLWMQIYSTEGILNNILGWIGINPQPFIYSAKQALPSIAFMSIWQGAGYQMLIFLGGLQAISPSLYEAAEIDNASEWAKFRYITLPALKPIMIFVLITITIGAFKMAVQPMVMTGGGPSYSTYTLVYNIYQTGTVNWEIGTASAMSMIFAAFVIVLTIIQNKITGDKEE